MALEFKKDQAMAVQKQANETYGHGSNGWHVRSIDAFKVEHLGALYGRGKGKTARKIYNGGKGSTRRPWTPWPPPNSGSCRG